MENMNYVETVENLVDSIKGILTSAGLGGEAGEYKLVTQSFLYKFLNDKFLYEAKKFDSQNDYQHLMDLSDDDYEMTQLSLGTDSAVIQRKDLIETIYNQQNVDDFSEVFDSALNDIALDNNDLFSVETAGNTQVRLFDAHLIADNIQDGSQRDHVARELIKLLASTKFDNSIFDEGFDFFSTIFEYMIQDYNKNGGGNYAEYYTPRTIAKIIADILIGKANPENVKVYDPAAGSGTLLMNVANRIGVDKCTVYSQDISQKSSNLLRLNLILNNLSHSIHNIVQGNTILNNKHPEKMDYIVSNPPFKLDFSDWRDQVESIPNSSEIYFAGIPKIPKKKKNSMAIYELFIQHIIHSMNENGKAGVVVPTGFLTAQSGIDKKIRKYLVDNKMIDTVVSMPSNVFANTGTNVSVIFFDKSKQDDQVQLIDASKLGQKVKENGLQKTVLSQENIKKIVDTAINREDVDDFSITVTLDEIKDKNYSFSAGQYFPVKIEYVELTQDDFEEKMQEYQEKLEKLFNEGNELEHNIHKTLEGINYETRRN
ncbi:type I restriction-modification system subunit M [Lactobacillus kefiranofaciens subsp. kefirgranum]|uniref:HsdM family class I SAM-dependent methyltransferase n=1 Tax=Lactobacillus kefiranofaciens TaxID=267818 RepID=UPI00202E77EA|nr:class I SAM-dependent DNA methyltransferase [Lactobacillus kefiranofaciens]URW71098.1 type I restriction-modification system subunit M [Lactobacillus kefiranofaciens subsp. kefirgranum]URW73045.1 type I restriction-modification system subunit M [Lactobacillus kefiranofaciens subsp. kefirgranum]